GAGRVVACGFAVPRRGKCLNCLTARHARRYGGRQLEPGAEGGTVPRLILIKGADADKQFELTGPVHSVGRDSTSSIRLVDTEVSRRHAEFRLVDGSWHLVDIGSANGSFVNGQAAGDAPLQPGDRIQIGQSVLVFSTGGGDARGQSDLAE